MNFNRTLKRTEYRHPNYFKNDKGELVEGDFLDAQLNSEDGNCFGQMSTFVIDYMNPAVSELIEEMFKTVEFSIRKRPDLYCKWRESKSTELELKTDEFRSQNIV